MLRMPGRHRVTPVPRHACVGAPMAMAAVALNLGAGQHDTLTQTHPQTRPRAARQHVALHAGLPAGLQAGLQASSAAAHETLIHEHDDHAQLDRAKLDYAQLNHAQLDHAQLDHAQLDHAQQRPERSGRSARHPGRVKDAVLTACGILGLLSLVWLVLAPLLGLSLVIFRTGSMSPTMPQGALALVQETLATELQIGDVVTVQRSGAALPVTHRIVSIDPGTSPAERMLLLQGDANRTPDFDPYPVTTVKRVVVAVPGLGHLVSALQTPQMLGVLTMMIAGLIVWAFWPAKAPQDPREAEAAAKHRAPAEVRL